MERSAGIVVTTGEALTHFSHLTPLTFLHKNLYAGSNRMKLTRAYITASVLLLPSSMLWLRAQDAPTQPAPSTTTTTTTTTTMQAQTGDQAAEMEVVKRRQLVFSANQAVDDGQRLLSSAKYDEAADRFQYALDALNNGGSSAALYARAQAGLAAAKDGQAHDFAKDAKFAQAADCLKQAINLEPTNPLYREDLEDLKRQQMAYEAQVHDVEGTEHNPAVTDDLRDRVAAVQKLLFEGDDYFKTGQYEIAEETYSKILILDPYNKAARDKMKHVELYRTRAAEFRHSEYEDEKLLQVNQDWSESISPDIVIPPTQVEAVGTTSERADITRKLQSIIIDKVNFDKLDIAAVIQFLTEKSKELDPDHKGINFVLRLTSDTPPAATSTQPTGAGGANGAATAAPPPPDIHRAVSITLDNVPLSEILGYIVQQTNLQYSVEDYAVYLRPSVDEGETLTVRTFLAPANFFSGSGLNVEAPANADPNAPLNVTSVEQDAQPELESRGIKFPAGASAVFLRGSSKLVVRDTPEELDLINTLIENLSKETPQVNIEAKLAEFNQDSIKGLSFNYLLGSGTTSPVASFGVSTALRDSGYTSSGTGTGGLTPDGIDTLIEANTANNSGTGGPTFPFTGTAVASNIPNTLTIGTILDGVGFAAVIEALDNTTGVSLISAPSVTTQNGLKASIDIVREFPYPTSFEKPKLSSTEVQYSAGPGSGTQIPGSFPPAFYQSQQLELGIPPTPREFETQDVGVSLEVKPTTYPDQRIDLDITKAQVVDFDGFIDYGVPITARLSELTPPQVVTPGTINQPVFETRSIVTTLQLLDGQTAVLGGLINESTQEINDKIPVLGDLPLVGRLFQSKVSERTKKNLIIFVTARLIRSNGKPQYIRTLNAEPAEEALPEPPPLGTGPTLPNLPESEPGS
jgi:general secretion pathway protein D